MKTVFRLLDSAARSKACVFITGESGTGKEVCAQTLHDTSPRNTGPFIAINCAAIPAELFESEFFGHVKGAFSGALSDRKGAVEVANGGTLFLDELCEMELNLQAKLLRFLQTGIFSKVGSSEVLHSDVRLVCATNRNPIIEVAEGRFREDLYYRLNVIPVKLPFKRTRRRYITAC
ncbi:sigma-54 factor interaction domain-containing protein [Pseudoalteromonas sp. B193]